MEIAVSCERPGPASCRLAAGGRWPPKLAMKTTGSAPIFGLAILATIVIVALWLLLWRNR
jgi:hypothetical protein